MISEGLQKTLPLSYMVKIRRVELERLILPNKLF